VLFSTGRKGEAGSTDGGDDVVDVVAPKEKANGDEDDDVRELPL
jgi:hypothetical protein